MNGREGGERPPTIVGWQAQLMRTVEHWAQLERKERVRGAAKYAAEASDDVPAEEVAAAALDAIQTQRELAEQLAIEGGVDPAWVRDIVRTVLLAGSPLPAPVLVPDRLIRATEGEQLIADLLQVELYHLDRMTAIAAAIEDRQATGRWLLNIGPEKTQTFIDRLQLRHQRVCAHADAVQITGDEGRRLWGDMAEGVRRQHAIWALNATETGLASAYVSFTMPTGEQSVPPYIDPGDGAARTTDAAPPSLAEWMRAARMTFQNEFVAAATGQTADPDSPGTDAGTAIAAALSPDTALATVGEEPTPPPGVEPPSRQEHGMSP
ncbi:hypothetical protein IU469_30060 [Nocardia puris]|uniref:hypothetical protein n=1 Tax=Nocardia puris TaxID=208602 RepID=UPI0018960DD2|nr:hypothetical protein [Nocardia puris]MBF6369925.1 hypothetical protein [Nocardia puris]